MGVAGVKHLLAAEVLPAGIRSNLHNNAPTNECHLQDVPYKTLHD